MRIKKRGGGFLWYLHWKCFYYCLLKTIKKDTWGRLYVLPHSLVDLKRLFFRLRFTIKPFCTQELGPQISLTWVWDIWLPVLTGEGAQEGSEQQVREFFQTSADIHVRWDHCSLQVCYLSQQHGSKKAFIISLLGRTQLTEGEMWQVLIFIQS